MTGRRPIGAESRIVETHRTLRDEEGGAPTPTLAVELGRASTPDFDRLVGVALCVPKMPRRGSLD